MSESSDVREFHEKHDFAVDRDLKNSGLPSQVEDEGTLRLLAISKALLAYASTMENGTTSSEVKGVEGKTFDLRLLRAHLMLEELGEALLAMAHKDEKGLFDALCDLNYVTHGTGVAFDLPIELGHQEVHRSNMTKDVKAGGDDDLRCRNKGKNYSPPDLTRVLREYRNRQ